MGFKKEVGKLLPDELFLKIQFFRSMGKPLRLKNPVTFNEKLQWLKLYDRRPEYKMMVDKYKVRDYIAMKLGPDYLIPLIGTWEQVEDVDFGGLPNRFVLKCNHNSGVGLCVCKDKGEINIHDVKEELNKGLKDDYYLAGREWPYKDVSSRIIAEQFITDGEGTDELTDYKFFCFDGVVDCVMVAIERDTGTPKFYFFDQDWKLLRLNIRGKEAPRDFSLPKPERIDEMFKIAAVLSAGIPFVRVDLYQSGGRVFFGELTFFPQSGFDSNLLPETDIYFGERISLPKEKIV